MRLAVGITTILALAPPETLMKRSRMRRSFSLFSAPPMGTIQPRVPPEGILLGIKLDRLLRRWLRFDLESVAVYQVRWSRNCELTLTRSASAPRVPCPK